MFSALRLFSNEVNRLSLYYVYDFLSIIGQIVAYRDNNTNLLLISRNTELFFLKPARRLGLVAGNELATILFIEQL